MCIPLEFKAPSRSSTFAYSTKNKSTSTTCSRAAYRTRRCTVSMDGRVRVWRELGRGEQPPRPMGSRPCAGRKLFRKQGARPQGGQIDETAAHTRLKQLSTHVAYAGTTTTLSGELERRMGERVCSTPQVFVSCSLNGMLLEPLNSILYVCHVYVTIASY